MSGLSGQKTTSIGQGISGPGRALVGHCAFFLFLVVRSTERLEPGNSNSKCTEQLTFKVALSL